MEIKGRTALVTGAASGLGLALSEVLLDRGAAVVMADIEASRLSDEAERLAARGVVIQAPMDVAEPEAWDQLQSRLAATGRAIDLLVNNAGVGTVGPPVWELTRRDWDWVLGVNLGGTVNGLSAFLDGMVERGGGHVVNVASAAGLLSPPGMAPYAASKHAIVALSEVLHHELRRVRSDVGVTVVCPGLVETRMADNERNRPAALRNEPTTEADRLARFAEDLEGMRKAVATGRDPAVVAEEIVRAVESGRFYLVVEPWILDGFEVRAQAILSQQDPEDPS